MRKIQPKTNKEMMGPEKMDSKPVYPSFRMQLDQFPEGKKMNVGDTVSIEMKCKIAGKSQSRFQNDIEFEIMEIDAETEDKGESDGSESESDTEDDSSEVDMSKKELIKEHKRIIPILRSGSQKSRSKEAGIQQKELNKY